MVHCPVPLVKESAICCHNIELWISIWFASLMITLKHH